MGEFGQKGASFTLNAAVKLPVLGDVDGEPEDNRLQVGEQEDWPGHDPHQALA